MNRWALFLEERVPASARRPIVAVACVKRLCPPVGHNFTDHPPTTAEEQLCPTVSPGARWATASNRPSTSSQMVIRPATLMLTELLIPTDHPSQRHLTGAFRRAKHPPPVGCAQARRTRRWASSSSSSRSSRCSRRCNSSIIFLLSAASTRFPLPLSSHPACAQLCATPTITPEHQVAQVCATASCRGQQPAASACCLPEGRANRLGRPHRKAILALLRAPRHQARTGRWPGTAPRRPERRRRAGRRSVAGTDATSSGRTAAGAVSCPWFQSLSAASHAWCCGGCPGGWRLADRHEPKTFVANYDGVNSRVHPHPWTHTPRLVGRVRPLPQTWPSAAKE